MKSQELMLQTVFKKITDDGRKLLPPPLTLRQKKLTAKIPLSCGAELDTTIYLPIYKKQEKWPVVLVRNPYYFNDMLQKIVYRPFVEQGYALVLVTVRGALRSTGDWLPFEHEREDGRETIDWIARQSWCDGNIGTFGGSYLGHVQWALADYEHPAFKTMCISNYGTSGYDTFRRRGMFRQEIWTPWAVKMMGNNRLQDEVTREDTDRAMAFAPQEKLAEHFIGEKCEWYENWIKNERETDPYWSEGFWKAFEDGGKNAKVPILMQGGWFDIFQRSQFRAFRQLPREIREQSRYVVGPWDHGDPVFGVMMGKAHYPEENITGLMFTAAAVEWFDHMLKGKPYPHKKGTLEAYCIGENRWHTIEGDFPAGERRTFYLNAADKSLRAVPSETTGSIGFVYDPKNPVPMIGVPALGADAATPGLDDNKLYQPKIGYREDVISFLSEPFGEAATIAGAIRASLFVRSDAKATAFTVHVMEMRPDGNCDSIREDISDIRWRDETTVLPYTPGETVRLDYTMKDVYYRIRKGSRLRVDISSSCFPLYHAHPNTDKPWSRGPAPTVAHQTILSGKETASCIELPLWDGEAQ